jgi:hypothetical protein
VERFRSAFEKGGVLGERKFEFVEGDGEISSLGTEEIEEDKILNGKQSPFWKGKG